MTLPEPSHKLQSVNRTERLLDLIAYLLNAKEPISWQEIKNHFPEDYDKGIEESNQRKFERDKAELISLGIPIDYRPGAEGRKEGYIIEKNKLFLPEIEFTAPEASLFMVAAGAVLKNDNFPYSEQLESALNKIIGAQSRFDAPSQIAITYGGGERTSTQPGVLRQVQDALERRKTIRISYHAFSSGEMTERKVDPYGLVFTKGNWRLIGWDHLRRGLRSFVLSRITKPIEPPKRPGTPDYEIPADFSLRRYQNQQPWELEFHEPVEVTLRVSRHRLPELLPQLTSAQRVNADTFKLKVTNQRALIGWALSQKSDVKVLAPASVKQQIAEALRTLLCM